MSLMDRFNVLSQSAKDKGLSKDILAKAFAGSSMDGFDNGSEITDVICWDEGPQSAIVFLNEDWNVLDFSWVDEDASPDWEWKSNSELAGFFASCISYAKEHGIPLDEAGCRDASDEASTEKAFGRQPKNLLHELQIILEGNSCSIGDVAYVEVMAKDGNAVCISPERFIEIASGIDYMDGIGGPAIHEALKVVLKDGSFIGRMWADGSEWFRFYEKPAMNPKLSDIGREGLCILSADVQ